MSLLDILNEIDADASKLYKQQILKKHKDCPVFQEILLLAYSPEITFYIKKIPDYTFGDETMALKQAIIVIRDIADRKHTGNDALKVLTDCLSSLSEDDATVIERVIDRDLRCGISANSINKVHPFLIPVPSYMGACGFSEKKAKNMFSDGRSVFSEVKYDGRYVNIIVKSGGNVSMVSRKGKPSFVPSDDLIVDVINMKSDTVNDLVFNGEILMDGVSRYESNGIVASIVKIHEKSLEGKNTDRDKDNLLKKHGMTYVDAVNRVYVTLWDYIPYDYYVNAQTWNRIRMDRLNDLEEMLRQTGGSKVQMTEYVVVNSYDEAIQQFSNMISRGEEGTILKSMDGAWKHGKPVWQVKIKLEFSTTLKIVGFNEGNGKYKGMLGSLITESSDGLVKADPYAFSDVERNEIWDNRDECLGKYVEIKCNGLSHDRDGNYSLLHPVFKEIRDDTTPDSLDDIKDIQHSITGIKEEL